MENTRSHRTDFRSAAMDQLVEQIFVRSTPEQQSLQDLQAKQGLPPIFIGPLEGQILLLFLKMIGAKRGVEIGTLGGYSTTWLARAVGPEGRIITIEKDALRAENARENLALAGFSDRVEVRAGLAQVVLENLNSLKDLDFVFVDADKENYPRYVEWAIPRLRSGGLLLCDNAYIWGGMRFWGQNPDEISYPESGLHSYSRAEFEGMSRCWRLMAEDSRLQSVILPTGEGLGLALKL